MKYFILIFVFTISLVFSHENNKKLAICSIFQDDAKYIPEWIEFHKKQGVSHFYLYENNSTDDFKTILKTYVDSGLIEIICWDFKQKNESEWSQIQTSAYMNCITNYGRRHEWIAFLDTDEFLFSPKGIKISYVLNNFKKYAAVSVNWVMYGNGGIDKIDPDEKMVDRLCYRTEINASVNHHVKTIVRPKYVNNCINPHYFLYQDRKHAVTENKEFIDGPFSQFVSVNLLRINHYWQRDRDFFWKVKTARQKKWRPYSDDDLKNIENLYNDIYDPILSNTSG